jgi:hypothetical protein
MKFPSLIKSNEFYFVDAAIYYNAALFILSLVITYLFWLSLTLLALFYELHHTGYLPLNLLKNMLPWILAILGVGVPGIFLTSWIIISKSCSWFILFYKKQQKEIKR